MATPTSITFRVYVDRPESDFGMTPHEISRSALHPSAKAVWIYLASHNETFRLTHSGIATTLGMSRNTVGKHMQTLRDGGYLQVLDGGFRVTVPKNCAEPAEQASSSAQKLSSTVLKNCAHKKTNQKINQEPKNTRSTVSPVSGQPVDKSKSGNLSTAQARAWLDGEKTSESHPIHTDWAPNSKHAAEAGELGLALDDLGDQFRAGFTASGEKRDNWGSAFMVYLRDAAAAREKATFKGVDVDVVADVQNRQVDAEYRKLVAQQSHVETSEDPWAQSSVLAVPAAVDVVAPIQNARVRDDLDWIIRTWGALSVEGVELAVKLLSSGSPRFEVATDVEKYRESRVLVAA